MENERDSFLDSRTLIAIILVAGVFWMAILSIKEISKYK